MSLATRLIVFSLLARCNGASIATGQSEPAPPEPLPAPESAAGPTEANQGGARTYVPADFARFAPREFVRRLRVEFACRELSLTNTPLLQIALAAGFYDQSHFYQLTVTMMMDHQFRQKRQRCDNDIANDCLSRTNVVRFRPSRSAWHLGKRGTVRLSEK
jgi:AraC-like DNA-binding protein